MNTTTTTKTSLELAPITLRQAGQFVQDNHRHHEAPTGGLFAVSLLADGELVGVGIAGRPVAGGLQDGRSLEILRCCLLPGYPNGCSMIYRALVRAGEALGYRRFLTYILESEHGRSLKAAGFTEVALTRGGFWARDGRPRRARAHLSGPKRRFEVQT